MSRKIAGKDVYPIGLGCMNLSHAYGIPPTEEAAQKVLQSAFELGINHFDTAALYGFGANEKLLGKTIQPFRDQIQLASKCGMTGVDGVRVIDGRPETLQQTIDQSLSNLQVDHIDLYYLHRWDKSVPIEDSVGAMADMVAAGKIGAIGLSEVSADTLKKAHAVHPIAALQTEYSLWTRNPELAVLKACEEMDVAFVAFSPLARGFLSDVIKPDQEFVPKDIRNGMPRFQAPNLQANLALLEEYRQIAKELDCTASELALAWVLHQSPSIVAIPGTTQLNHLAENYRSAQITLSEDVLARLDKLINQSTVSGPRYNAPTQTEIDTEEFAAA